MQKSFSAANSGVLARFCMFDYEAEASRRDFDDSLVRRGNTWQGPLELAAHCASACFPRPGRGVARSNGPAGGDLDKLDHPGSISRVGQEALVTRWDARVWNESPSRCARQ